MATTADPAPQHNAGPEAATRKDGHSLEPESVCNMAARWAVLAAVQKDAAALERAAEVWKRDREIVLAAVNRCGSALKWAAESCKGDHDVVSAAVRQYAGALHWASSELLENSSFASEAKKNYYMVKIGLMSGRSCCLAASQFDSTGDILQRCCGRLGLECSGKEQLVHGSTVVMEGVPLCEWPGTPARGLVAEYSLVLIS
mmetsp:Transcript_56532/g.104660  ORF Transcript_56532/g.104660 Transcript_56532/m.104660 type:complete len:201 (-) Transcript_56532:170-772(-)